MSLVRNALAWASVLAFSGSTAWGATIAGTVKGPDGAGFKGAFVEAQNTANQVTFNTLSHAEVAPIAWRSCPPAPTTSSSGPWAS